jgi:hypothetical protein
MGYGVSGLESAGADPSIRNRLPAYFFSIFDTSETIISMEIPPPNMAVVYENSTSVTNSQNSLPPSVDRAFINYSQYYTSFLHFPGKKNYYLQTFEDRPNTENTEKIFTCKKQHLYFISH